MLNSMVATLEMWVKSVTGLNGVFLFRLGTMVRTLSLKPPMV